MTVTIRGGPGLTAVTALTNASSPYTVLASDEVLTCDTTSGVIAVTLLTPVTAANKHILRIVVIGTSVTNAVTLTTPAGVIGVGGAATWALLGPGSALEVVPDGTNYQVLSVL